MLTKLSIMLSLLIILISTFILLTGCADFGDKSDSGDRINTTSPERTSPNSGLSPISVEFAVIGDEVDFTAVAPKESSKGMYHFAWWAYYGDYSENVKYSEEYSVKDLWPVQTGTKYLYEKSNICSFTFNKADLWTVKVRVIGGSLPDDEVLGEYTATVNVRSIRINPSEITDGELGRDYTFTAEATGPALPAGNYTYTWHINQEPGDFWDTSIETNTNKLTYTFQEGGNYEVTASVSAGGKEIVGKSNVTIADIGLYLKTPDNTPLVTSKDYTFVAESLYPQFLPEKPYYKWDFGDESGLIIPLFNEVTHAFTDAGQHTIKVDLCESEADDAPVMASASTTLLIEPSAIHLTELQQMNKFALDFSVQHDYAEGNSGIFLWDWDSYGEVVWDGVNFSMEWSKYNHSERMTGRVSEDGTIIEQLKIRHEFSSSGSTEWYELEIQNLPFWEDTMPDRFIVDVDNEDVEKYVTYFNSHRTVGYHWTDDARLYVRFTQE